MTGVLARRRAGVLLHPTSLPGRGDRGTLGAEAFRFVDFLRSGGFSVWQTLPLGPTDEHGSPYGLRSAHAGDTRLIDTAALADSAALPAGFERAAVPAAPREAYDSFVRAATAAQQAGFARFVRHNRRWLVPFGWFEVLTRRFDGAPWWRWPSDLRNPTQRTLATSVRALREEWRGSVFMQYLFDLQWSALKRYANANGIALFGDLPFYMDLNSVEVWWYRSLFKVDSDGAAELVAGVPPDYFSADGQLWGNPLYDWDAMAADGFAWWLDRIVGKLERFDVLRIDHFRALESYWEIPAGARTAREGCWRPGHGDALLGRLRERRGDLPLVAEDLGLITDEVRALRDRFELPGMVVLQFAFDGSLDNPHLPANHVENSVVYTGTHDNETTMGWYGGLDERTRETMRAALDVDPLVMPDALIEAAYASRARLAVIPLQDLLGLGREARMNTPGTTHGNWRWRFAWREIDAAVALAAHARAVRHDRLASE
jgi:4-alpha-glucanotransferase